jgi:sugar phosphate permease
MADTPASANPAPAVRIALTRRQWFVASLLFRIILLNYLDRVILSLVSPVMREQLGIAELQYADALNALLLAYAITYVGCGVIPDWLRDVPQALEHPVSARETP